MGGNNESGKKRPRSYYKKCMHKKRKRWNSMDVGMQGFLVTCNKNESQAVKEMYNLFNEYADKLYGPEQFFSKKTKIQDGCQENSGSSEEEEEEDIEKALNKELSALKEMVPSERRFQQLDTGAKNCLFIKTTVSNPCELIHTILNDIYQTQIQKCRFALRVLPIQTICRANMEDISKTAEDLFEPFFRTSYGTMLTYGISFKARMTSKVSRNEVIDSLCRIISEMNPLNKVNYNNPDLIVIVEVLRGLCCLSVVKDFNKFRKYNLQEVARAQQQSEEIHSEALNGSTSDDSSTIRASQIANSVSEVTESSSSKIAADVFPKIAEDAPSKSSVETSKVAVDTSSQKTAESPSKVAVDTSSQKTAESPSKVAVDTSSQKTAESPSKFAVDTSSQIAVESSSKVAVDTSSQKTAESPSKFAVDTSSQIAAESPSKVAVDTSSQIAAESPSKVAVDTSSQKTAESPSKDTADSTSEKGTVHLA